VTSEQANDQQMSQRRKRNVLLAIAATIVAAGAIVAILTAGSGTHSRGNSASTQQRGHGQVATVTAYLGTTRAQLRRDLQSGHSLEQIAAASGKSSHGLVNALVAARAAQLQASVKAGKLSSARLSARLATLRKRLEAQVRRTPGYVGLSASASYLGLSTAELDAQLQAGHSLAQIADATPGKSASGLIDARVGAREAALKRAVASGRISAATERALLVSLRKRVTSEVERKPGQ